jgi:hypothetical protein
MNNIAAWGNPLGIRPLDEPIPEKYSLSQNYPNPFNPVTTIRFGIPAGSDVRIIVYDITGSVVSEPVNQKLLPGEYEVDFDAANLSSGTYFYKLVTQNYSETKKMIVLK